DGRHYVHRSSLATSGESHAYEGFWDTFPAALAIYEEADIAKTCFHLGVNWMVGVSSSHGFDEGWTEGPGYSNSKFKWMLNGMLYLDSVFPEFEANKNPWLISIGEWFRRVTPVGLKHAPWGHQSNNRGYYEWGRASNFRRYAYFMGDGVLLRNWRETTGPDGINELSFRPWTECLARAFYGVPEESYESDPVGVFPLGGWVMAGTQPPSSPDCYKKSVGMIFQCRPVGAYSHGFASENSFHIYGYGEDLSYASGTSEYEPHAFHTMSHNTIMIDGMGQSQPRFLEKPRVGYLRAFQRGDGYVYWAGDATNAYPNHPLKRSGGWWGTLDPIYNERDVSYLQRYIRHVVFLRGKYFIIYDDLACDKPAQYSWLYHILPGDPVEYDRASGTFDYKVGDVPVRIVHIANRGDLDYIDMQGLDGFKNPLTGEDYTEKLGRLPGGVRNKEHLAGHNIYLSNRTKQRDFHFLAVIAPIKQGDDFPEIKRLDDKTVSVDGDIISFDPSTKHNADIVVDVEALRRPVPVFKVNR
ncbi:heparinase II/III family protein, partial [Candidatus Latescibacterota bacterium]